MGQSYASYSEHRESYDSLDQIRAAPKEIRAQFHQYQTTWLSHIF